MAGTSFSPQMDALDFLYDTDGPTRIKTCGMFRVSDIKATNAARPHMVGLVVNVPRSHRSLTPRQAMMLAALVDEGIQTVGVFVDEPVRTIVDLYNAGALAIAQLHGHEDNSYIADLKSKVNIGIIQAFQVHSPYDIMRARKSNADMVLLDAGQGSGRTFDWSLTTDVERPFMLAGGLSPENVAQAAAQVRPWGVDLSSGLETNGLKDPAKIVSAVKALRKG